MVIMMSSGRISRYKEEAKADMIRGNRRQIRCPCRTCKLLSWIDTDSGQLEEHLLRRGFWIDFDKAPTANEGDAGGQDHHDGGDADGQDHHDEGDADEQDHHEEGDADGHGPNEGENGSGLEDEDTQTSLNSALQDPHVQELLLRETSNVRGAAREKAKLDIIVQTTVYGNAVVSAKSMQTRQKGEMSNCI